MFITHYLLHLNLNVIFCNKLHYYPLFIVFKQGGTPSTTAILFRASSTKYFFTPRKTIPFFLRTILQEETIEQFKARLVQYCLPYL